MCILSRRIGDPDGLSASVTLFGLAIVLELDHQRLVNPTASLSSPHATLRGSIESADRNVIEEQMCGVTTNYVNSLNVSLRSSCA